MYSFKIQNKNQIIPKLPPESDVAHRHTYSNLNWTSDSAGFTESITKAGLCVLQFPDLRCNESFFRRFSSFLSLIVSKIFTKLFTGFTSQITLITKDHSLHFLSSLSNSTQLENWNQAYARGTHCASLGGQQDNYEKIIFQKINLLISFFV